jgi:hypothetical protein
MTATWTVKRIAGYSTRNYYRPLPAPRDVRGEIATQVLRWYNRFERSWVVSLADAMGRQVGPSTYVYSLDDALAVAERMVTA